MKKYKEIPVICTAFCLLVPNCAANMGMVDLCLSSTPHFVVDGYCYTAQFGEATNNAEEAGPNCVAMSGALAAFPNSNREELIQMADAFRDANPGKDFWLSLRQQSGHTVVDSGWVWTMPDGEEIAMGEDIWDLGEPIDQDGVENGQEDFGALSSEMGAGAMDVTGLVQSTELMFPICMFQIPTTTPTPTSTVRMCSNYCQHGGSCSPPTVDQPLALCHCLPGCTGIQCQLGEGSEIFRRIAPVLFVATTTPDPMSLLDFMPATTPDPMSLKRPLLYIGKKPVTPPVLMEEDREERLDCLILCRENPNCMGLAVEKTTGASVKCQMLAGVAQSLEESAHWIYYSF